MRLQQIIMIGLASAAVLTLGGCEKQVKAPTDTGVCYFIGHPHKDEIKFNVIARDVPDLEHCAVQIFVTRRSMLATGTAGEETVGTYQGSFLFVTNTEVRYSQTYEGPTFPLLVKAGNKLVQPGSIVVEDDLPTKQETVVLPKDLPQKDNKGEVVTPNSKP